MINTVYNQNLEAIGNRYNELKDAIVSAETDAGRFRSCDVHAELYDTGERCVLIAAKDNGPHIS